MDLTIVKDYRGDGNAVNDTNKILHLHEENKRLGSCLLNKIKELEGNWHKISFRSILVFARISLRFQLFE